MRKTWIIGLGLLIACSLLPTPASALVCRAPGKTCLFVDSSSCVVACAGLCWATSGGCSFGFGYDAICRCHDNKCNTSCQKSIGQATGQYGLAVNQILTSCEESTTANGGLGGNCYFQASVQAEIAGARDAAMANITASCTESDAQECFGVPLDDFVGRLLKNAESNAAGNCRNIWEDMVVEGEPTGADPTPTEITPLFID